MPTLVFASLLLTLFAASATAQAVPPQKPQTIATATKLLKATIRSDGRTARSVQGAAAFVITEARPDNTVAGTLVYNLPDEARRAIAESTGKPLADIPASVARPNLIIAFEKNAACPQLGLDFPAMELPVAGALLQFNRFKLHLIETPLELPRLFCVWTRQVNANHENRLGVLRRINRLLKGDEE
jgi:hypothetical protein